MIARSAPEAQVIDITHGIPRHDIRRGAIVLRNAIDYVPQGVHLAVVDPTVGTPRRAVAVRCGDGQLLVGPDNGLLSLAWEHCGGAVEAVDLNLSPFRLEPVSATFHGRDLFAPVAAARSRPAPAWTTPASGSTPRSWSAWSCRRRRSSTARYARTRWSSTGSATSG